MGIRFETQDGRVGTLDVSKLAAEELNGVVVGAKNGIIQVKTQDGSMQGFKLGEWAAANGVNIVKIEGFNGPDTALDTPPTGMNYLDQAVFYNDGMDLPSLEKMFPKHATRNDGRVVVLDSDGLWKTMWSPYTMPELPPMSFQEQVNANIVNDPKMTMRTAGVTFLMALAGLRHSSTDKGGVPIPDLVMALEVISRNAPYENKFQIGKLMEQTTGLEPWKLYNALLAPKSIGIWLHRAMSMNSFQFRMLQLEMTELVTDGLRALAQTEFAKAMKPLIKLEETDKLVINMKGLFGEFIQFLISLDMLRDISKTTGLNEWLAIGDDKQHALDDSKLPPMPEFVNQLLNLMKWMMPIVKDEKLAMARGKNGLKSLMSIMMMIDGCIYHLAGVPDHSAKYKMFMSLKRLQAQIESKLSFIYHPDPAKNLDGLKENPFMIAKSLYADKRESIYKLCQVPKEEWNQVLLNQLRSSPNLEQFYDKLDPRFAELFKSFAAMETAYDMQPWVDVEHTVRTHDAFSQYHESLGSVPPESGYLAKNSPRAVFNISETLVETAAMLNTLSDNHLKELLRNPALFAQIIKTMMVSSVNRELGVVEILGKVGITNEKDIYASPDANRIWEDPERVDAEKQAQIEQIMQEIQMEQMAKQGAEQEKQQAMQMKQEEMRDGGGEPQGPEVGGPGPMGPPQQAMRAKGA